MSDTCPKMGRWALGQEIIGAWLVLWWGMDDASVWDALTTAECFQDA